MFRVAFEKHWIFFLFNILAGIGTVSGKSIVKELLPIAEQCREVGFTEELTRRVVSLQPVEFKGRLYSKEHKEKFRTEHSTATVERNPQEKGKFRLCIDGMPILEWFKMKFQELKEKLGVSHTQKEENKPKRGLRL